MPENDQKKSPPLEFDHKIVPEHPYCTNWPKITPKEKPKEKENV